MRPIGFSTGALARGRFREGLALLGGGGAVELSALKWPELQPLLAALPALPLSGFAYVSLHAPSRFDARQEAALVRALLDVDVAARRLPIVLHPDTVHDFTAWAPLSDFLLIENMDRRKRLGQTAAQLDEIFACLPRAGLCLDLGHVWQVDPTLAEARRFLGRLGGRLRQLHLSQITDEGQHQPLSPAAVAAFQELAPLIRGDVPVILETPVEAAQIAQQIGRAREALP
jgi:hypothetical protein